MVIKQKANERKKKQFVHWCYIRDYITCQMLFTFMFAKYFFSLISIKEVKKKNKNTI